jgi:hypothetical protein
MKTQHVSVPLEARYRGAISRQESLPVLFGRNDELARLRSALTSRRSQLLHGPAGVGKTILLRTAIAAMPDVLFCDPANNFPSVLRQIASQLVQHGNQIARKKCGADGARIADLSVVSLKGIVTISLSEGRYSVVLDHAGFTSQTFVAALKDVVTPSATRLVMTARSTHMEDAGFMLKLFPFREDRLGLCDFDPPAARTFMARVIREARLDAENLSDFEERLLEASHGNPGAVLRMVEMAREPRYRSADRILFAPLYIDFKLHGLERRA